MRKQIAAANWKMNLTISQAEQLVKDLLELPHQMNPDQCVILAVPFPYLAQIQTLLKDKRGVAVAAQNCSNKRSGAYTGEVSVEMLCSLEIRHVIIGHSERREYFNETNATLAEKIDMALENHVTPIFCCGEPLQVRESGLQNDLVGMQLRESLFHVNGEQLKRVVIAYEPVWAIGTGKTASSAQAQEMHDFIRSEISKKYGQEIAGVIPILYGGSVKGTNAKEIFSQPDIDGGLVGGASLNANEFNTIINSLKSQHSNA